MNFIEERVKKVVSRQLGIPQAAIEPEISFANDLGADSLDEIELVMAIEDEFEMEIPDDDAERIKTVQQAINYIAGRGAETSLGAA